MEIEYNEEHVKFLDLLDELNNTFLSKNHDYGSSFSKTFEEFGLVSAVVRMNDKMERLKTLTKSEAKVNESVRDTLMDLSCYCVLTVMELDKQKVRDIIDNV